MLSLNDFHFLNETAELYNQKLEEYNLYIQFISIVSDKNTKIFYIPIIDEDKCEDELLEINFKETAVSQRTHTEYHIQEDIKHIHNSNIMLQLYNAMEALASTLMREIHQDIYKEFDNDNIYLAKLKPNLSKQILQHITNIDKLRECIKGSYSGEIIDKILISKWLEYYKTEYDKLDKSPWFSGNVDVFKISTLGVEYHFIHDKDEKLREIPATQKQALSAIKNLRNKLAHGKISFIDQGKNMSLNEIKKYSNEIFEYFRELIDSVEEYLKNKEYLS